jgi:hypothetical protein
MSEAESEAVRFVGGLRTQTPLNAPWPLVILELTHEGVNMMPRSIARAVLIDEHFLWSEISAVEGVRGWSSVAGSASTPRGARSSSGASIRSMS